MDPHKDSLGHLQTIKAALHCKIGLIVEDIGDEYGITFSRPVIATLAEFINRQIEIYAIDLEAFSKHAHRSTINCEDVKLLVRRNPKLSETIKEICDSMNTSSNAKKGDGSNATTSKAGKKKGKKRKFDESKTDADSTIIDLEKEL